MRSKSPPSECEQCGEQRAQSINGEDPLRLVFIMLSEPKPLRQTSRSLNQLDTESAPVCFAADTAQEQQSWGEELRRRTQACSLSIQGLNLEGCSSYPSPPGVQSKVQPDENVLAQTLELLDELLKKKSDGKKLKKGDESMGMSQDVEEVEQASIMAHQEALRKATHLRQRKISTELKVETLQRQLRKPSKKSQPRAIPELPEGRELVEEQLQELTQKLRLLEGNLGQTERQAQKVRREWDKKMEEVYQHLFENRYLSPEDALRENWADSSSAPRILVSRTQDEGRSGGSLRVRAAKFMPRSKKQKEEAGTSSNNGSIIKKSASNTSLNNGAGKAGDESDDTTKSSDSKEMEDTRTASKSRRSPLRIIGDFLESRKGRFGSTHKKSFRGRTESQNKRLKAHHGGGGGGGTGAALATVGATATAASSADAASLLSAEEQHMELPYLQLQEQESRLPSPAVEHPPSSHGTTAATEDNGHPAWRTGSSPPPEELASPGGSEPRVGGPGGAKDGDHATLLAAVVARNEELPLLHTDSGSCCSEDDAHSLDSGSRLLSEDPDGNVRCHIDPEIMAEIEAFEQMAQSYLKRHGHDFPF
uniref:Fibroblast growth factor receptor 3-like protein n=1 Tax=Rhipicephalus appendiculatus TaxID=34631 RepID=A0A131YNY7_RHIAP